MSAEAPAESIEIMTGGWRCAACGWHMYPRTMPGDDDKGSRGLECANSNCKNKGKVVLSPLFTVQVVHGN